MADYGFPESEAPPAGAVTEAPRPMEEEELQSAMHRLVSDAVEFVDEELSPLRAEATKYYMGKPFGNEEDGRSKVVLTEVRDTINAILPSLLRVFFGPERVVEYRPSRVEDIPAAEQATEFINTVVVGEDNPGFLVIHSWFKDALVRKLGIVKWWWDDTSPSSAHKASGLTREQVDLLSMDDSVSLTRVVERSVVLPTPGGESTPAPVFDVEFTRKATDGRARFACVPPEEFLFNREARSLEEATFVAHRSEKTRSELVAMGLDAKVIEEYGSKANELDDNEEERARVPHDISRDTETGDRANDRILYVEGYPKIDYDGDGIAELRKVCTLGSGYHVVVNDPASERPFALLGPDPEPHTLVGLSIADYTMDLQIIKSSVMRAVLDSLALSIFPRTAYVEGEVNLQDILNTEIGAPIRMRAPGMATPFTHPFVGREAFPVIQYLDEVKENRTGISKAAAGLNADALQSTTKAAVAATVTAAQQHIEMIARIFAETGVKQLFRGLLRLLVEHQPVERLVRLRNQFTPIDPRSWNATMDVSVNVALGSGLTEEKVAVLLQVAAKQEQVLQTLGPANPLVTLAQYRNTLVRVLALQGFKDGDQFFQQVDPNWQPPQPAQPPPDPNMMIAQAEIQKAQAEVAKKQAEIAMREQELAAARIEKQMAQAFEREKMQLEDDRERDRLEADIALRGRELELKYQAAVDTAHIKADMERDREATRVQGQVDAAPVAKPDAPVGEED